MIRRLMPSEALATGTGVAVDASVFQTGERLSATCHVRIRVQLPSLSGLKASSAGVVETSL
jgi:hypothetical protein